VDADRVDSLARSLIAAGSRRQALAALTGALALILAGVSDQEAEAKKRCPPCKKRKQGRCKKKSDGTPCPGGTCDGGRCATCTDGVKNGSETGVDCGGSCPRCTTGQGCTSPNDCASAFCSGGTCQTCTVGTEDATCGSGCFCAQPDGGGANLCVKNPGTANICPTPACPPGTICMNVVGSRNCYEPCGAP
jgi:hypothetical protein